MTHLIEKFVNILKTRRYNTQTIAAYRNAIFVFYNTFRDVPQNQITEQNIVDYLADLATKKDDEEVAKQAAKAIKLFYELIYNRSLHITASGIKKPKLPVYYTRQELRKFFKVADNIKQKAMMMCIYATGLRLSEVIGLKKADVDFVNHTISISGEGKRKLNLSKQLVPVLEAYLEKQNPKIWFFESNQGGQYSPRTIQLAFQKIASLAKIDKEASVHTLRHSFAVHLLENGTDLHILKELLGHKNVQTTSIYSDLINMHIQNIISPLDLEELV